MTVAYWYRTISGFVTWILWQAVRKRVAAALPRAREAR